MAKSSFIHQVKSIDTRVKTFNVSGILWDVDIYLIEQYRRQHQQHQRPKLTDVQIALELWKTGNEDNKFIMSQWLVVFWSTVFGAIVLASIFGNLVVMWTVLSDKKMRSVTNYFLVNLSISDLAQTIFVTVFSFVFLLTQEWKCGPVMCYATQYVSIVAASCSSFTLTAISLERYFAIMYPLRRRPVNELATGISIVVLWTLSLLIALPQAMYSKYRRLDQAKRFVCVLDWPDGSFFESSLEFTYNFALTIIIYVVPLCTMLFTYTRAGTKLWRSIIGEPTEQQMRKVQSKRKVVKMLVVSVTVFGICWLPYHAYFLASWMYPQINYWQHIQQVYIGIFWLAMSSSMHSPFIYCFMNPTFRSGFKRVFTFCWCCCYCCWTRQNPPLQNATDHNAGSCRPATAPGTLVAVYWIDTTETDRHQAERTERLMPPLAEAQELNRTTWNKKLFSMENLLTFTKSNFVDITLLRNTVSLTYIGADNVFCRGKGEESEESI